MITVRSDFEKRCNEVGDYFKLLERIVEQDAQLHLPHNQTRAFQNFDSEIQKILKSNVILMLYNLMESSIKSALVELFQQISARQATYSLASDEIRSIWITKKYKNFNQQGGNQILGVLNTIATDILELDFDTSEISGNIDARKVREFAEMIGFSATVHYSTDDGAILVRVKSERNMLAHGEKSFSECGRSYTISDLKKMKNQTITYLRRILSNIEKYLRDEKYLIET